MADMNQVAQWRRTPCADWMGSNDNLLMWNFDMFLEGSMPLRGDSADSGERYVAEVVRPLVETIRASAEKGNKAAFMASRTAAGKALFGAGFCQGALGLSRSEYMRLISEEYSAEELEQLNGQLVAVIDDLIAHELGCTQAEYYCREVLNCDK